MVMLKHLSLTNFKTWESLDLELAPVTGIFGTNSSGKSSIIQFLLMLKHTKNATDNNLVIDFGGKDQLINLGSYKDIVFHHDTSRSISWYLQWNSSGLDNPAFLPEKQYSLEAQISQKDKDLKVRSMNYGGIDNANRKFKYELASKDNRGYEFELFSLDDSTFLTRMYGEQWDLPAPIKTYRFPYEIQRAYQNAHILGSLEVSYEYLMNRIFYLGPLRSYPDRQYLWSGANPTDVGFRGENFVAAILAATQRKEMRKTRKETKEKPFQEVLAWWLKEIGLISNFEVRELTKEENLYRVYVEVSEGAPEVLITDVGFGVSQFLPILVLLYYVPEGSIVILEQPEIHLHPSIQSGLADMILSIAECRNLQVIVESHSEHLLQRFRRRIADQAVAQDFIKLYFCEMKGDRSTLNPLTLDEYGYITNWPDNFFGDSFEEICAIEKAVLKRKIADPS